MIVAVVVSIAFILGAVYFYKVRVPTLLGYLFNLLVMLLMVILAALLIVTVIVLLRKFFSRD